MSRRREKRSRSRLFLIPWIVFLAIIAGACAAAAREYAASAQSGPAIASTKPDPAVIPAINNVRVAVEPTSAPRSIVTSEEPPLTLTSAPTTTATATEKPGASPSPGLDQILAPVFRSTQYSQKPFVTDPVLASSIASRIAGFPGKVGIAVEDLNTGRGVLVDPDSEYQAASLFKLSVMYEVYKQRESGKLSFDETLLVTDRVVSFDLGTLDRPAGSTIQLGEALERMITISDNSSAILLTDRVGAYTINQDIRGIGLQHTRLIAEDLVTSPGDMLTFLEMLAHGDGVNARASAEMIQLMARQRVNDRIPRKLPSSATIAHKTGNLPGVVNDVGIVFAPDASFIVAVLIDKTTDEGRAAQLTADIADIAYRHFREAGVNDVAPPVSEPTETPRPRSVASPPEVTAPTASTASIPTVSVTMTASPEPTDLPTPLPARLPTVESPFLVATALPVSPVIPNQSLKTPPPGALVIQGAAASSITLPPMPIPGSSAPLERRLDPTPQR